MKKLFSACVLLGALMLLSLDYSPGPSFNHTPSRALNTSFQPTARRGTICSYTVTISRTLSLANTSAQGKVYLEVSPDNTNWTTINSAGTSGTLTVALTISIQETTDYNLQGSIPKGWYCRLRTVTTGGATAAMTSGQELMF